MNLSNGAGLFLSEIVHNWCYEVGFIYTTFTTFHSSQGGFQGKMNWFHSCFNRGMAWVGYWLRADQNVSATQNTRLFSFDILRFEHSSSQHCTVCCTMYCTLYSTRTGKTHAKKPFMIKKCNVFIL